MAEVDVFEPDMERRATHQDAAGKVKIGSTHIRKRIVEAYSRGAAMVGRSFEGFRWNALRSATSVGSRAGGHCVLRVNGKVVRALSQRTTN